MFNLLEDIQKHAQSFGVSIAIRDSCYVLFDEQGVLYENPLFESVCGFFDMVGLSGMTVRAFVERQNEIISRKPEIGKRRRKGSYKRD